LPLVEIVDLGCLTKLIRPVRVRLVGGPAPFLSENLIRSESTERGTFGFIDSSSEAYRQHVRWAQESIGAHCDDDPDACSIIVLPEFAGSPEIEEWIITRLKKPGCRCVVIGGTYYRYTSDGRIESVCPIVLPGGHVHYQLKFKPSPFESRCGCQMPPLPSVLIFRNTGFGDFAVLVCSDALQDRGTEVFAALRGRIDLLVVPARNRADDLPNYLRTLARNEGWAVVYCNGLDDHSKVFSPLHSNGQQPVHDPLDLREMQRQFVEDPDLVRQPTRTGFHPRPRHWPATVGSPIDFARYAKVLAVGSHFDDVWLGCSATLMLLKEVYGAEVHCTSLCNNYSHPYFDRYDLKDIKHLHDNLGLLCEALDFRWVPSDAGNHPDRGDLEDRAFMKNLPCLQDRVGTLLEMYQDADLLFIPRQDDVHDDHVATARAFLSQFRRALVLQYEIKDFRQAPFRPSLIVNVGGRSRAALEFPGLGEIFAEGEGSFAKKKAIILERFFRQMLGGGLPPTFDQDHCLGRMRVRAAESSGEAEYAEAFAAEILIS
jgi:hypothetical protein